MKFVKTKSFAKQTMLCAKYNYKMDIAVKKQEAFEDGMNAGLQKKTEEDAIALLAEGDSPEKISRCLKMPLEKVLELKEKIPVKVE